MKKALALLFALGILAIPPYITFTKEAKADSYEEEASPVVAEDVYKFTMNLKVPQVLDNSSSLGYRKYKSQTIAGYMYVQWKEDGTFGVSFSDLVNKNFKVNGCRVTYEGYQDGSFYARYNYIGNNETGVFKTPCICFSAGFEPSYAIGKPTEDNSFTLILSGSGSSTYKKNLCSRIATSLSGYASGIQGCGCTAYGHKSPTRDASLCGPNNNANDVVATYGKWKAKWVSRKFCQ